MYIYIHLDPLDRGDFHTKAKIDQFRQNQEKKKSWTAIYTQERASKRFLNAVSTRFSTPEPPKCPRTAKTTLVFFFPHKPPKLICPGLELRNPVLGSSRYIRIM